MVELEGLRFLQTMPENIPILNKHSTYRGHWSNIGWRNRQPSDFIIASGFYKAEELYLHYKRAVLTKEIFRILLYE